jgi:hypothetical protein
VLPTIPRSYYDCQAYGHTLYQYRDVDTFDLAGSAADAPVPHP